MSKPAIVEVPLTVSETPLEEAPPASPATPIEQNKLVYCAVCVAEWPLVRMCRRIVTTK